MSIPLLALLVGTICLGVPLAAGAHDQHTRRRHARHTHPTRHRAQPSGVRIRRDPAA